MTGRRFFYAAMCLLALIVAACANIGSPDGGEYDETPPVIVRTSPAFGSIHSNSKKIVIEFDENIKLENASEKVIVSPPQKEQPEINASGKRITVQLIDTLQPGRTYTIDFSDAIEDNNEGNPMGDYAFTFSTGDRIDTMQISGYVLDASNLEPIKGIFVGLYAVDSLTQDLPDSVFTTKPFERISRTDSRGHFIVKGVARGTYRAFALKDQDQSYTFSQPTEQLAFSSRLLTTSCKPDLRPDTIWHDSIHYDSIVMRPYTHFYPDDVVLLAFKEKQTERFFLKSERQNLRKFTLYFTNRSDSLPKIEGLNFNADNAFIVNANATNDTIHYWISDSLVYNLDTLSIAMTFEGTDTAGVLTNIVDTLDIISKVSREKELKQQQKAYEDWVKEYKDELKQKQRRAKAEEKRKKKSKDNDKEDPQESEDPNDPNDLTAPTPPTEKSSKDKKAKSDEADIEFNPDSIPPMPETFLDLKTSNTSLAPDKNFDFILPEPIAMLDTSLIKLSEKIDSTFVPREYKLREIPERHNAYRLYAEWMPGHSYVIEVDTGAFVGIYGQRTVGFKREIKIKSVDEFSTLFVNLHGVDTTAIVELLDNADKVVKRAPYNGGHVEFYFVNPGTYYLRLFCDTNGNGVWDEGCYEEGRQPETVYYYPRALALRAMWDFSQDWNPAQTPLYMQKPKAITKQKPDKEKSTKNKNAERLAQMKKKSQRDKR